MLYTHVDVVSDFAATRDALTMIYGSFVHVTPFRNFQSILATGLEPRADMDVQPPADLVHVLPTAARVVCLYPAGAVLRPDGSQNSPLMSVAVDSRYLPESVGLDWAYPGYVADPPPAFGQSLRHAVIYTAARYGSIVSYDLIKPNVLRVFCKGNSPSSPRSWTSLLQANPNHIVQHD